MTANRYRKKPVVIEAVQYDGNPQDIAEFTKGAAVVGNKGHLHIETLEGTMTISPLDWIIKGVAGEFYPCKPKIFEQTYEAENG